MRKLILLAFIPVLFSSSLLAQKKVWTLRECIDRAWQQNVQLRISATNNAYNSINETQARAALYPNLNASASQNFNFGRSLDPSTYQYTNQNVRNTNFSLSSNVVLFNGFQYRNTIKKYELDVQSGNEQLEKTKNDIALNVAGAYLQILLAQEQLQIARNQIESGQKSVDRTKMMVDVGKTAEANLYQLRSQLASYKSSMVTAENNLALAKLTLQQLMELPVSEDFSVETPILPEEFLASDTMQPASMIYETALKNQPQIKASEFQIKSALMNYDISKGAYLPRLTLGGSLNSGYSSARNLVTYEPVVTQRDIGFLKSNPTEIVSGTVVNAVPVSSPYSFGNQISDNFAQSMAFTLSVPIFTNYVTKSGVERAKVNIDLVNLNSTATKNELRKNVEQAFLDLKSANKKYAAAKEQLSYSEISLRNIKARFDEGLSTANDLFIENNNYLQAKSQLLQSKYDYIFKQKVLDFYMGKTITL